MDQDQERWRVVPRVHCLPPDAYADVKDGRGRRVAAGLHRGMAERLAANHNDALDRLEAARATLQLMHGGSDCRFPEAACRCRKG